MITLLYTLWSVSAGCGMGFQSGINGSLGKKVGIWEANALNMGVGSAILIVIVLIFAPGELSGVTSAPLSVLAINAFLPTLSMTGIIFCAPRLGTGTTAICQSIGSFVMSLVIDAVGMFGVKQIDINAGRIIGIVFMILGLYFVHILYHKKMRTVTAATKEETPAPEKAQEAAKTASRLPYILLMIPIGALGALVSIGQTALRTYTGAWGANFWSFFLSFLTGLVISLILRKGDYRKVKELKPYQFIGAIFGIYSIFAAVTITPVLGSAAVMVCRLTGTIITALLIDNFGLMGMPKFKINGVRLTGLACMLAGIVFVSGLIAI